MEALAKGVKIKIMKKRIVKAVSGTIALAVAAANVPGASAENENPKVYWQCSTENEHWADKDALETTLWDGDEELYISVDENTRYQALTADPWGGCFCERGRKAMEKLTKEERSAIIESLFGSEGLGLTVGRMPLGNNDFSINRTTSYDELPAGVTEDYDLKYFSIDTDREYLMPYIDEALKYCPDLKLWASSWSPPSWMKTNGTVHSGGKITWTKEILTTYANYFARFIKDYRAEGYNVYMVMPQNEPTMNTAYASCVWTGAELNEFVRDYLAPTLEKEGLSDVDIYLGTFTDSQASLADPTLNDPETSRIIKGLGVQWWAAPLTKRIYRQNKDKGYVLMQSETKCGNGGNSWSYAEEQFDCVKEFFDAGVNSYMLWNMVLDEKGENTAPSPWHQNSPITVDSVTNKVTYNGQYHLFKHFTYYIKGRARRIKTDGNYVDKIAFQNENGENVLVVKNGSSMTLNVAINFNGRKIKPALPPHSINTFRIDGDNTDFDSVDATYSESGEEAEAETIVKWHNAESGYTLSVDGAAFDNGKNVIAWTDQGTADQMWTLEKTPDGYYKMINFNSLKALGVYAGSPDAGARCVQWDADGSPNQEWKIEPVSEDGKLYYYIINKGSGLYLGFEHSGIAAAAVQKSDAQKWEAIVIQGSGIKNDKLFFSNASTDGQKVTAKVK